MALRLPVMALAVLIGLLLLAPAVASAGGPAGGGQGAGDAQAWMGAPDGGTPGGDLDARGHAYRSSIDRPSKGAARPDHVVSPAPTRADAMPARAAVAGAARTGAPRGGDRAPADPHGGRHRGPAPAEPVPYAAPARTADEQSGPSPGAPGAAARRKDAAHPPAPVPDGAEVPDPVLLLRFLLVLGFRRVRPGNVLEHPLRRSLHAAIGRDPGLDLAGCAAVTGANRETLRYHLALLACCGKVVEETRSGSVRYFLPDPALTPVHRALVHALNNESHAPLLATIRERPGIARHELAQRLGVAGPSVTRQVQRLIAEDLVIAERGGRSTRYWLTPECVQALGPAVPPGAQGSLSCGSAHA